MNDWRKLFTGHTVRAMNPNTGEPVNIRPYVHDPAKVEGEIVRFNYPEETGPAEYHVLCWHCWSSSETLFLSGLCANSGTLKQFNVDRISALFDLHNDISIANPKLHFLSRANISNDDLQLKRQFNAQRSEIRKSCALGLKVLTYISLSNGIPPEHEAQVVESYLRARLGSTPSIAARLIDDLMDSAKRTTPTLSGAKKAFKTISDDDAHLDIVWIHSEILLSGGGGEVPVSKIDRVNALIAGGR